MAATGKTHTGAAAPPAGCGLLPRGQCWASSGTAVAAPGDPVPNHPHPIPVCETGVLLTQPVTLGGTAPLLPALTALWWPWGCSPTLSCLHRGQIGPRCKLLLSRVGSLLPAPGKGYRVQIAGNMPATLLGMSVGSAYPSSSPPSSPLPHSCPMPQSKPQAQASGGQGGGPGL